MLFRSKNGRVRFEVRNRIEEGARIEVLSPLLTGSSFIVENIHDDAGNRVERADRPSEHYEMDCPFSLEKGDILRIRLSKSDSV